MYSLLPVLALLATAANAAPVAVNNNNVEVVQKRACLLGLLCVDVGAATTTAAATTVKATANATSTTVSKSSTVSSSSTSAPVSSSTTAAAGVVQSVVAAPSQVVSAILKCPLDPTGLLGLCKDANTGATSSAQATSTGNVVSAIVAAPSVVVSQAVSVVNPVVSSVAAIPSAAVSVVAPVVSSVAAIPSAAVSVVAPVVSSVSSVINAAPSQVSSVVAPIVSSAAAIPSAAVSVVAPAVSSVSSIINAAPSQVSSVVAPIVSSAAAVPSAAVSVVAPVVSSVSSVINAAPSQVSSVVAPIVSVIVNGPASSSVSSIIASVTASSSAAAASSSAVVSVTPTSTASSSSASPSASAAPGNPTVANWAYSACIQEGTNGRALTGSSFAGSGMTVESCLASCDASGFMYAGLEYSSECFCGSSLANGASVSKTGTCDMPCSGNAKELCGGSATLSLYTSTKAPAQAAPLPAGWSSTTCMKEVSGRAFTKKSTASDDMTVAKCIAFCGSDSKFAAVEYGRECYCGTEVSNGASLTSTSGQCNTPCAGAPSQTCGGPDALQVYTNAGYKSASAGAYSNSGCVQEVDGRLLRGASIASDNMTIETCTSFCQSQGMSIAGLEYGKECYCSNSYVSSPLQSGQCNMPCAGNANENCGGPNALNIFTLGA